MTVIMPRPRPPYLHHETTRHGKTVWYVRVGKGPRTRLSAPFGSTEFQQQYQAAINETIPAKIAVKPGNGTLAWAIGLYRQSAAWLALSKATRQQRDNIFHHIIQSAGTVPLAAITRKRIVDGRERRASKPAAARHFVQTMRGLFRWAVDVEFVATDPTLGITTLRPRTEGHPVWDEDDIAAFEKRWPIGTRERVAFDVILYTGLRRGDAVKLGRQHVRNGAARIKTEKTGEWVTLPILPALRRTIDAGPCGDLTFIASEKGQPRVKEAFGDWFGSACKAALVQKRAHRLRKAGATRCANNGATESELEAIFGWRGGRMASHYTRSANRERLSIGAADKLAKGKT